jgi:hypothetical protein
MFRWGPKPKSFIVQKLLIQKYRDPKKQAQDVLYIHDTLELFGSSLEELRRVWEDKVRPKMSAKTARRSESLGSELFQNVTDVIRRAVEYLRTVDLRLKTFELLHAMVWQRCSTVPSRLRELALPKSFE